MSLAIAEFVHRPSRVSEADLFRQGSGPSVRVVSCCCGGSIAAIADNADDVVEAVRAHNGGRVHDRWRERTGR